MNDTLQLLMVGFLGMAVLLALAWTVGRVEANARDGAWQRIAAARKDLHEEKALLDQSRCDACQRRREHYRG